MVRHFRKESGQEEVMCLNASKVGRGKWKSRPMLIDALDAANQALIMKVGRSQTPRLLMTES